VGLGYEVGDLVGVTDGTGKTVQRFIDGGGRVAAVTDPLGRRTLNRLATSTDALGGLTQFAYDAKCSLATIRSRTAAAD
jgi:YD repeat-containing protein